MTIWVPIIISALALLISGISAYFQFLYRKEKLTLNVPTYGLYANVLRTSIAILNSGNKYGAIIEMRLFLRWSDVPNRENGVYGNLKKHPKLPVIVKPNEILVFEMRLPLNTEQLERNNLKDKSGGIKVSIDVEALAINSKGQVFSTSNKIGEIKYLKDKAQNIRIETNKTIDLFEKTDNWWVSNPYWKIRSN